MRCQYPQFRTSGNVPTLPCNIVPLDGREKKIASSKTGVNIDHNNVSLQDSLCIEDPFTIHKETPRKGKFQNLTIFSHQHLIQNKTIDLAVSSTSSPVIFFLGKHILLVSNVLF